MRCSWAPPRGTPRRRNGRVIGKKGRNVPKDRAVHYIAGFTVFNDISALKMQGDDEMSINLGPSKGKDFCNIFGPCIATEDEFTHPYELPALVRINGELVAESNTKHMLHKWDAIVAHASLGVRGKHDGGPGASAAWYARRDSNPQPSASKADALSS